MSDLEQFRRETRNWLEANCPPEMRRPMTSDEDTFWGGRSGQFADPSAHPWEVAWNPHLPFAPDRSLQLPE